jgi:PhnB protein
MQLNPYLNFKGDCEAAFQFYERVLGGKIECLIRYEGTPAEEQTPPEWRNKIIHGRLNLNGQVVMASDCAPDRYQKPHGLSLTLSIEEPAKADSVFHDLAEDGEITMPIQETFWAVRFGMLTDRFGIPWMINCEKVMQNRAQENEDVHALA